MVGAKAHQRVDMSQLSLFHPQQSVKLINHNIIYFTQVISGKEIYTWGGGAR